MLSPQDAATVYRVLGLDPALKPAESLINDAARQLGLALQYSGIGAFKADLDESVFCARDAQRLRQYVVDDGGHETTVGWAFVRLIERRLLGYRLQQMATREISPAEHFPHEVAARSADAINFQFKEAPVAPRLVVWQTPAFQTWWNASLAPSIFVDPVTALAPTVLPDGPTSTLEQPYGAGVFRWRGQEAVLKGIDWRLACALWGKGPIGFAELGELVWNDDTKSRSTIGSAISRLNKTLLLRFVQPPLWRIENNQVVMDAPPLAGTQTPE